MAKLYHFTLSLSSKRTRHRLRGVLIMTGPAAQRPELRHPARTNFGQVENAMWKRDDAVKPAPAGGRGPTPAGPQTPQPIQTTANPAPATERSSDAFRGMEKGPVNIGKSVVIKGELTGSEDL